MIKKECIEFKEALLESLMEAFVACLGISTVTVSVLLKARDVGSVGL